LHGEPPTFNQHYTGTMDYWDPAVTRSIKRVVVVRNAQETGTLLERLGTQPGHIFSRAERTMSIAVQDDICARPAPIPETRANNGAEAVLASTPTALTQSSTSASSERDSLVSLIPRVSPMSVISVERLRSHWRADDRARPREWLGPFE
jgi:hypothetical protein